MWPREMRKCEKCAVTVRKETRKENILCSPLCKLTESEGVLRRHGVVQRVNVTKALHAATIRPLDSDPMIAWQEVRRLEPRTQDGASGKSAAES